jgi:2-iminobutanoate/2-iminopropanoate deaminase
MRGIPSKGLQSSHRMHGVGITMTVGFTRTVILPKNTALHIARTANLPNVPGLRVGPYIFLSGMGPIDPLTGERSHGPIAEQIRLTLSNMKHMLESAGSSMQRIVRIHLIVADKADIDVAQEVYYDVFQSSPPTLMVWSMQLRFGNGCEIECVALAN